MPPELWSGDAVDVSQRHSRYVEAAEKLEAIEKIVTNQHELKSEIIDRVRAILES